jgi:hypothetical protein
MFKAPPPAVPAELQKRREAEVQGLLVARAQVDALSQALALLERAVRCFGLRAKTDAHGREAAGEVLDISSSTLGALQDETNRSFESLRRHVTKLQEDVDKGLTSRRLE